MHPTICVAAERVLRDAETNQISVINILEGIAAEGFPVLVQTLGVFALWERTSDEAHQWAGRVTISLGEQELVNHPIVVDFQDNFRHRSILSLNGLVIPGPGVLRFSFTLDDGPVAEYVMNISAGEPTVTDQSDDAGILVEG